MNQIQAIKAEIKRWINLEYNTIVSQGDCGQSLVVNALEKLLSFIKSLEKEKDGVYFTDGEVSLGDAALEKEQPKEVDPEKEIVESTTIKGWVARDSVEDAFNGCGLILHHSKPWRTGGEWSNRTIAMHLPWSMFPDLSWEDEPIEVELTIRKV